MQIGNFRRRFASAALIAILVVSAAAPALADELQDKQRELGTIQQQMDEAQRRTAEARQRENTVAGQLRVVQRELDAATGEFNAVSDQLTNTEDQIEANTELMAKLEKKMVAQTDTLKKRMRDMYKNGQVNYVDVLFGAKDFNDFTTRVEVLKRLLAYDSNLIASTRADRELVARTKAQLEKDRAMIAGLHREVSLKRVQVESRRNERQYILDAATNDRETNERAYNELMETSRQIERMIRRIQSGEKNVSGSTGQLMWPVQAPITSNFGWRVHPIYGTQRFHSGLDLGADYGDPVRAADGGVVIHSDWLGGYGYAVIIDHGNGISTLYGHNSQLVVSEGQRVTKGQVISRVGSTGDSTGPHLHFEVRQNGSPVSPLNFLP